MTTLERLNAERLSLETQLAKMMKSRKAQPTFAQLNKAEKIELELAFVREQIETEKNRSK